MKIKEKSGYQKRVECKRRNLEAAASAPGKRKIFDFGLMKKTNISSESSRPIMTDAEEGDKESQFVDAASESLAEVSSVAVETNPSQSDSGQ